MTPALTAANGLTSLLLYGLVMVALSVWVGRGRVLDKVEFLLAGRSVTVWVGAMSIAASWIWAPALFVSSQKAYEQGLPGIFWFSFPNVLALLVFAPLALRIRQALPAGFTLPELMHRRHGRGVHRLYLVQFFGLQVCSFAVQVLAGATLIRAVTGLNFHLVALVLAAIALTYALIGGLRASVVTDLVQMGLIFLVIAVTIPWVLAETDGAGAVAAGLGGASGRFRNLFDPWVFYAFGIPATIGLIAGPIGDQQHWQRAYALRSNEQVIKTFVAGALLFVLAPLSLSLLGFVAAGQTLATGQAISNPQMVGPLTVARYLPGFMMIAFSIMLLSGLCSTLDSVLCAGGSLAANDLPGSVHAARDIAGPVTAARLSMLIMVILALGIAFIPGLKILHLWLFYGTWRASTMIPTILTLYWSRLHRRAVFIAILASLLLGAPMYAAGALLNYPHLSVAGSLLVVVIGLGVCGVGSWWITAGKQSGDR